MKPFRLLLLLLLAGALCAQTVPPLTGRVVDDAGFLKPEARSALADRLRLMEEKGLAQMAILTVSDLGEESVESFSIRVAEAWKLGSRDRDNGLLLIISAQPRKVRLEVGYGLEGILTDQMSGYLIRTHLVSAFRKGDFAGGLSAFVETVEGLLAGEIKIPPEELKAKKKGGIPLLFIIFMALVLIFSRRGSGPGPFIMMGGGGGSWGGSSGGGGFSGGGGSFGGGGSSSSW